MSEKLRAVVVGLNRGRAFLNACTKADNMELVAMCDIDPERKKEACENYPDANFYENYSEMLKAENPDLVFIATPSAQHCEMTVEAANCGCKGIYCEKPMAKNLGEAELMMSECQKNNVYLIVGHQRRETTIAHTIKNAIDTGLLGDIYLMRGVCPGDVLSDASHLVDMMLFLNEGAKPTRVVGQVFAREERYRYGHLADDGSISAIDFDNQVRVELLTGDMRLNTWAAPYPGWGYQDFEIIGTKGRIWKGGDMFEIPLKISNNDGYEWHELPLVKSVSKDIGEGNHGVHEAEQIMTIEKFGECVKTGNWNHPLDAKIGKQGLEIIMAIYESARLRKEITLPLEQKEYPLELF